MKKLLLDISVNIRAYIISSRDESTYLHLYEGTQNNFFNYLGPADHLMDQDPDLLKIGKIEAEFLVIELREGSKFDEAAAREWLESLNLDFPPEDAIVSLYEGESVEPVAEWKPEKVTQVIGVNNYEQIGASLKDINPLKEVAPEEMNELKDEFRVGNPLAELTVEAEKVREIINNVKRGPDIVARRRGALAKAGYWVCAPNTVKNFGKSGTVKVQDGKILAQLECNVNYRYCGVYEITKL